jgi:hypothetical protein
MVNFTVRGADGREYSADLETVRRWVAEGRIDPQQQILRRDTNEWVVANTIESLFPPAAPPVVRPKKVVSLPATLTLMGISGLLWLGGITGGFSCATFLGFMLLAVSVVFLVVWFVQQGKLG